MKEGRKPEYPEKTPKTSFTPVFAHILVRHIPVFARSLVSHIPVVLHIAG